MNKNNSLYTRIIGLAAGVITSLVVFGGLLALLWAIIPQSTGWRLGAAFLSVALALYLGGYVVAWLSKAPGWFLAAIFGLLFGGFSFTYILGLAWIVLAFAAGSALVAALGALTFQRRFRRAAG